MHGTKERHNSNKNFLFGPTSACYDKIFSEWHRRLNQKNGSLPFSISFLDLNECHAGMFTIYVLGLMTERLNYQYLL